MHALVMAHCCVVFCANDSRYKDKYLERTGNVLHFHKFPKDEKMRREWIVAIRRDEGANFKVSLAVVTYQSCSRCGVSMRCVY